MQDLMRIVEKNRLERAAARAAEAKEKRRQEAQQRAWEETAEGRLHLREKEVGRLKEELNAKSKKLEAIRGLHRFILVGLWGMALFGLEAWGGDAAAALWFVLSLIALPTWDHFYGDRD